MSWQVPHPHVSVMEISTVDTPDQIPGFPLMSEPLTTVIGDTRQKQGSIFELVWEGDKTPRGTMVGGQIIGWTQNGVVTALDGNTMIGTYERLEEFGGPNRTSHRMRIRTLPQK